MEETPAFDAAAEWESPEKSRKRRPLFGEQGWLNDILRRRVEQAPSPEDDEEEEEETEDNESSPSRISGKGRSILRRLFGSSVKREPVEGNAEHRDVPATAERYTFSSPEQKVDSSADVSLPPEHNTEINQPAMEQAAFSSEQQPIAPPEVSQAEPSTSHETVPLNDTTPEFTPQTEHTSYINRAEVAANVQPTAQAERVVYQRTSVIDRPSQLGGLLALEYLGRKRADRKIKRTVSQLEKQVKQGSVAQDRLQQLTSQSREQLHRLQERRTAESVSIPQQGRLKSPAAQPERRTVLTSPEVMQPKEAVGSVTPTFERAEKPLPNQANETIKIETDSGKEIHYTDPERVLKEVTAAADKDAALEKVYERRGEIKDEPTTAHGIGAAAAASIATVLQESQQHLNDAERKQLARNIEKAHRQHEKAQQSMYKQAVISGFSTGAVILAALFVAFITR